MNASTRIALAVAMLALAGATRPVVASQAAAGRGAAAPLAITAACQGSGDTAALHVRLQNRSGRELAILFGRLVGTERTQVIDALAVLTTRAVTGATEDFAFVNPKHALLTGSSQPWILTLAAGATYEVDAPIRFFISRLTYALLEPDALPGTRIALDAQPLPASRGRNGAGAKSTAPAVWTGQIEFPIEPCG